VGGQRGRAVGSAPDPDQSRTVTFKPASLRQCARQQEWPGWDVGEVGYRDERVRRTVAHPTTRGVGFAIA
jgi:hypothetical protein